MLINNTIRDPPQEGLLCAGTKENEGVKRRLAIMAAQYVNIVFDMLIYS